MLDNGERCRRDFVEGRWVIETRHRRRKWEVVVEPDETARVVVVITAYPLVRKRRK
jgi:hypothetical protein